MTFRLNYQPRHYFLPLHNRSKRFYFVLAHRRAGKSFALAADMVERAIRTKKPNAQFAYCAPSLKQARTIIWKHFKTIIGSELLDHCKVSETKLSITLPNGSEIRVFGLNEPDSLRGFYLDGIVIDEAQDTSQELISTVIMPALADRKGYFIMSGTPKGMGNSFYRIYKKAKENTERWGLIELKASETGILSDEELAVQREELSEEAYLQEYELSFVSGNVGSIYAKFVDMAEAEERITEFEHVRSAPVYMTFDLGRDTTAIWFFQMVNGRVDVIDYQQTINSELSDDLAMVVALGREKKYKLSTCFLPHDAYDRNYINGKTLQEVFWSKGFETRRVPDVSRKSGINSARAFLKSCRIHTRCFEGIEALRAYVYKWSDQHQVFSAEPLHNWASHASDSFRYMSLSVSQYALEQSVIRAPTLMPTSGIPHSASTANRYYSRAELEYLNLTSSESSDSSWFN